MYFENMLGTGSSLSLYKEHPIWIPQSKILPTISPPAQHVRHFHFPWQSMRIGAPDTSSFGIQPFHPPSSRGHCSP